MNICRIGAVLIAAVVVLLTVNQAAADSISDLNPGDFEKVAAGGLLYDNWYSVLDVKTDGTHPAYPAEGKKNGGSTWRCKECHGWDYMGKDGAYAKGSHYTGIRGIRAYAGKSPEDIISVLNDKTHALGSTLSAGSYEALSYFVAYGQTDMDAYIDRSTKKAAGDLQNGSKIYSNICAKCHGVDGRTLNFKTPEEPEYLGTLSNKNPWETLHKIRYGQPSSKMPSLLFLDIKDQIDLLSYCQTLPPK